MSEAIHISGQAALEECKRQLKTIQCNKNDPDRVLESLESLCISLVMGDERYLRVFDTSTAIPMFVHMLEKEPFFFHGDAMTLLFRALTLILEYVPSSCKDTLIYRKNIMKMASLVLSRTLAGKMKYGQNDNGMLLEETLRIIRFISKDEQNLSIVRLGITDIIRVAVSENTLLARQAFETLLVICSKIIFPSEEVKTSVFSCLFIKKKKRSQSEGPVGSDKLVVLAVETILLPFLQTTIQQYAASLGTFPEAWSFLEIALQCLGTLIQRALLCHRPTTARAMVTHDLCRTLFRLLLIIDGDVTLEPSVRSDRTLFCETVLDAAITADWTVACESLLTEEAKNFYKQILGESTAEIATLLDDPFPREGITLRSTQRRDKNHTTSIAAIRLFMLACPRVPCKAFGPKPKLLLPVHQWMWEDEMRQSGRIDEEECITLDSSWSRLSRDAVVRVHAKVCAVDLHIMKISRGFGEFERNISRKFVPFVFHFVDEANLNLPSGLRELMSRGQIGESNSKNKNNRVVADGKDSLSHICVMNSTTVVNPAYLLIADEYLERLCNFAVAASGQMTKQLATCACAALLQAAIRVEKENELIRLLRKIMRPLCEMLRESLVSADKATKSVVLMMMVWLLHHPCASEWKFSETAQRCGVLHQLDITAHSGDSVNANRFFERHQTRTEYLAETASLLHRVMSEQLATSESPSKGLSGGAVNITAVREAVKNLSDVANIPGVHAETLGHVFTVMKDSVNAMTALEISTMRISETVLKYLLGENYIKALSKANATGVCPIPSASSMRTAPFLFSQCNPSRLKCLLDCAATRPQGVQALIENLVSVLPFISTFTLVESLTRDSRVTCRTPMQAVISCARISPPVTLCSKKAACGLNFLSSEKRHGTEGARVGADSAPPSLPREFCPQGHKLLADPPREQQQQQQPEQQQQQQQQPEQQQQQQSHSRHPSQESLCDFCEKQFSNGFHCDVCDFHMCGKCFSDPEVRYEGGTPNIRPMRVDAPAIIEACFLCPSDASPSSHLPASAHLFSCIGDIERFFRTGSCSTKNTVTSPVPQSALQNADLIVERANTVLQRGKRNQENGFSKMQVRHGIHDILNMISLNKFASSSQASVSDANCASQGTVEKQDKRELHRLLCDALEERYVLYTSGCGRNPYQMTLLGSIYQSAFFDGNLEILDQLEQCLLSADAGGEFSNDIAAAISADLLLVRFADEGHRCPKSHTLGNTKLTKSRLHVFHHFDNDEMTRCCCGENSRAALNTVKVPKLVRKVSELATKTDILLLILLHHVLSPLMRKGTVDVDNTAFLSASITTFIAKSVAASALRVALLPPDFAIPRWANFILTEARFLIPLNIRERIARFFAYGARRALWDYMKSSHSSRPDRSIKLYPAEWARLANHKYRVKRDELMHDAFVVLRKSADSRFPISIEFQGDVGVGQGPTAHFYTLLAREVQTERLHLWGGASAKGLSAPSPLCLYPSPAGYAGTQTAAPVVDNVSTDMSTDSGGDTVMLHNPRAVMCDFTDFDKERAQSYYAIGAALGRAFTDEVIFPLDLSPAIGVFLRQGIPPASFVLRSSMEEAERPIDLMGLTIDDVELMDQNIAKSLRSLMLLDAATLTSLDIPFTLPGDDKFELIPGGTKIRVNEQNVSRYSRRVVSALLYESVMFPLHFLISGFRDVVPCEALKVLDSRETIDVLCGSMLQESEPLWTSEEIRSILVPDHGYQRDSPQMQMLVNILANRLTPREQRSFLLFCTGCPRLPAGGVRTLGAITVVKRTDFGILNSGLDDEVTYAPSLDRSKGAGTMAGALTEADWPLPSVNTCFYYLKLPPYPTEELMYRKLKLSITQGGEIFELS